MKARGTDAATRARMSRQPQRGTAPERAVRAVLRDLGYGYRVNVTGLPGSPDLANRSRGWVIFVHGCFWHQHAGCPRATIPKRNREWWQAKLDRNRIRDQEKVLRLEQLGYDVLVVWECMTKDPSQLAWIIGGWFENRAVRIGSDRRVLDDSEARLLAGRCVVATR